MTKEQEQVKQFMKTARQDCPDVLTFPSLAVSAFRVRLIREELSEFKEATQKYNFVEIADALGDLLYVVLGAGVAYGIDLEPIFQEIHKSNMTKFEDGYVRADGKLIKGPKYSPPDLFPILIKQLK
jgi:predicted HAD superfamily Cof-like phosphohydrolase